MKNWKVSTLTSVSLFFLFWIPASVIGINCYTGGSVIFSNTGITAQTVYPNRGPCYSRRSCIKTKVLRGGYGVARFCPTDQAFGHTPPWAILDRDPCGGRINFCEERTYGNQVYGICCCSDREFCNSASIRLPTFWTLIFGIGTAGLCWRMTLQ